MVKYDIFISDINIILKGIKKYDIKKLSYYLRRK